MKSFFMKLKEKMAGSGDDFGLPAEGDEGYVELSTEGDKGHSKISVRPFILEDFADTKYILDSLREGYTIALVNIKQLKDKDLVELKRAVNKLKKTTDAINGDIAGFGEDWLCITPSFASIYRDSKVPRESGSSQPGKDEFEEF